MTVFAHPPEIAAQANWQWTSLPCGVRVAVGFDPDIARAVESETGHELHGRVWTVGAVNDEGASLLLVLHNPDSFEGTSWIEFSVLYGGLRLTRSLLVGLAEAIFECSPYRNIVVRVPVGALPMRATLRRLGFSRKCTIGDRHLYALTPTSIPEPYKRARARRQH